MAFKGKIIVVGLLVALAVGFSVYAQESSSTETIVTLTTYYPSPIGIYKELRAKRMAIGDNYYRSADPLGYCWPDSSCVYEIDGNADLVVEGNVGIGIAAAQGKLHLTGTLPITSSSVGYSFGNVPAVMSSVNDGFIFVPTGGIVSDLRLYIEDDPTDSFSIYGNSCGGGGCWDLSKSSIVATFKAGGNVGIGTTAPGFKLDVNGTAQLGQTRFSNSDIYFTNTTHNHTGIGNTAGYAAIENAANYDALMILGRAGTSKGRYVRLWDYLQVNGGMDITGKVGIGVTEPAYQLDVNGTIQAAVFLYSSDKSLKTDIERIDNPLVKIKQLEGVSFRWKKDGRPDIGITAQNLEEVFPELVKTNPNTGIKSIQLANLVAPLIEAVKALDKKITSQQKEIEALKAEISGLRLYCESLNSD